MEGLVERKVMEVFCWLERSSGYNRGRQSRESTLPISSRSLLVWDDKELVDWGGRGSGIKTRSVGPSCLRERAGGGATAVAPETTTATLAWIPRGSPAPD